MSTGELDCLKKNIVSRSEDVLRHLSVDLITKSLDEYDVSDTYELEDVTLDPLDVVSELTVRGCCPSFFQTIINGETGDVADFEERWNQDAEIAASASGSMSMRRTADPEAFGKVKGKPGNLPFLPGGFNSESEELCKVVNIERALDLVDDERKFLNFSEYITVPPGFSNRLCFPDRVEAAADVSSIPPGLCFNAPPVKHNAIDDVDYLKLSKVYDTSSVNEDKSATAQFTQVSVSVGDELHDDLTVQIDDVNMSTGKNELLTKDKTPEMAEFTFAKLFDDAKVHERFESIRTELVKQYAFELDMFQKSAVVAMENGDSVFVAAHTSAGKTVVADYAIALGQLHRTRVIYTSPIKALSNQKFRDFKITYDDVGLITGDIQLNTDAFCLVMTTEVLRSMLYNGSETVRELEWVIFDEVHYINDEERGHVWEEVLIMLPAHVKIVMLSATVPNCVEFADWVGRIKQRNIVVIQTLKRPVPLEHYLYTGQNAKTRECMFVLMDKDGQLHPENYDKVKQIKEKLNRVPDPKYAQSQQQRDGGRNLQQKQQKFNNYKMNKQIQQSRGGYSLSSNQNRGGYNKSIYTNLIYFLNENDMVPVVVFVFSRKRCDEYANVLYSVDLTTETEKNHITQFFRKCIDRLNGSDKDLPQVLQMQSLCERGFAIHHSGILPILKEVVELLFQRGLVKVLFATETFAMGVNMPARTVVFDEIEKFDGVRRRDLNPTEYVQMAGRAGRRGLDKTGIVMVLVKGQLLPLFNYSQLMTGKPVRLESKFRITYTMLLKLMRVEQLHVEDVLKRSYVEKSSLRLVKEREAKLAELRDKIDHMSNLDCERCSSGVNSLENLIQNLTQYFYMSRSIWSDLAKLDSTKKLLTKGRILIISYPALQIYGQLAVVMEQTSSEHGQSRLTVMIAADDESMSSEDLEAKKFNALDNKVRTQCELSLFLEHCAQTSIFRVQADSFRKSYRLIEDLQFTNIMAICKSILKNVEVENIKRENDRRKMSAKHREPDRCITRLLVELVTLSENWSVCGAPVSLPGRDIKVNDVNLYNTLQGYLELVDRLENNDDTYTCRKCPTFKDHFAVVQQRQHTLDEFTDLTHQTSADGLLLSDEYKRRIQVLRHLNYIDRNDVVNLKGKVACEISHMEMLITELMLDNHFVDKACAEIAALFSAMTCQFTDNNTDAEDGKFINPRMKELKEEILDVTRRFDHIQLSYGIGNSLIEPELKFGLMDVVYEWANGKPFKNITELTSCQEGIIVRCIQRLDEVCKDVRNAAKIVGDPCLARQMEETSAMIKRGIVFAASLYTSED